VPTPNIDRLAREGVRYTQAFCTAGVCAPSRNAIITGMYQTSTGGHNMRTMFNTFPEKTGLPKEYSIVPPPDVKAFPEYLRAAGYYCTNNDKTDYQFEPPSTVWDESGKKAHWRNRKPGQPFFAVFNSVITHESQVWARAGNPLRVSPARVKLPPYYPDTETVRTDVARFYSNVSEMDDEVGQVLKQLEEDGLLDKTIVVFWSDHGDGLPFYKREIYKRGLHVPLIVRFPDKRQAGTTDNQLISMIDLAPTVLSLANIPTPRQMQGQAFLGKHTAKQPRQYVFAARDRLDSEYDRVRTVLDGKLQYVRNYRPELPLYMDIEFRLQQPMMREMLKLRDEGKLNAAQMFWFKPNKPKEELYDLEKDPYELNNLAGQAAYRADLERLRKQLEQWERDTKDLGGVPEKELVKRMWNGGSQPPATQTPTVLLKNRSVTVSCPTQGASIGYKTRWHDPSWRVYQKPFSVQPGDSLYIVAHRIGYQPSVVVKKRL
jgi:arylsulfatase A-like enzyme